MTTERFANFEESNNKLVLSATYAALSVAFVLSISKFLNFYLTGSVAIQASALDSLLDIAVSFANFIAIKMTQRKPDARFPYGYDKIAALIAFLQVILVGVLAIYLFAECIEKLKTAGEIHDFGYGVSIICFALALNTVLVAYQSKIVKKTGSLVIKADMLHYKTDFFTNLAILLGLICVKMFDVHWLDPIVGMLSGVYLMTAVYSLCKTSLSSLLDMSNKTRSNQIVRYLNENGCHVEKGDVWFLFTGTKNKVCVTLEKNTISSADNIRALLQKHTRNCAVEIKAK